MIWHPFTVLLGWRKIHARWPKWWEFVAICLHDVGYWGCPSMDGERGKKHPARGAELTRCVVRDLRLLYLQVRHPIFWSVDWMKFAMKDNAFALASKAKRLALGHSKSYAKKCGWPVSDLCLPDKASILFDPAWFYILRGKLSGEIHEYVYNSPGGPNQTARQWFCWYHQNVRTKVYLHTHTNTL